MDLNCSCGHTLRRGEEERDEGQNSRRERWRIEEKEEEGGQREQ